MAKKTDKKEDIIDVVYAFDEGCSLYAMTSIYSLLENNRSKIRLHLIIDDISDSNIKNIKKMCPNAIIHKLNKIEDIIDMRYEGLEKNKMTYSRLFLDKILNNECEKALWIDSDTLICSDINELINENLDNYVCGMVEDQGDCFKTMNCFKEYEIYFNAGIILFNLKEWRKQNIYQLIIKEIIRRKGRSIDYDQSYINCILKGKIKNLDKRFNCLMQYSEDTNNPIIYHFAGEECRPLYKNFIYNQQIKEKWIKTAFVINDKDSLIENDDISISSKKRKISVIPIMKAMPMVIRKLYVYYKHGYWPKIKKI